MKYKTDSYQKLEEDNQKLKAEVAYLKKLRALIQKKKSQSKKK